MKTVDEMIEALQEARSTLGDKAPILLLMDNQIYELEINVRPKGRLGPGSVLLTKVIAR